jgi:hypothetical protein
MTADTLTLIVLVYLVALALIANAILGRPATTPAGATLSVRLAHRVSPARLACVAGVVLVLIGAGIAGLVQAVRSYLAYPPPPERRPALAYAYA